MLTVIAAGEGGIFAPMLKRTENGPAEVYFMKNTAALKKLRRLGISGAVVAPSAMAMTKATVYAPDWKNYLRLLPRIIERRAELPLDELFISAEPEEAAEIIELCADCARLFTIISSRELKSEVFDSLYFNKGLILRRISAPGSRVGRRALCLTDGGRIPLGVESVELSSLGKTRLYGELDFLCEVGLIPTAELYSLAGLPLPETVSREEWGSEIFYLDIAGNL